MNKIKILVALCSLTILLSTATTVFAESSPKRIAGSNRYETAIQVSKAGWSGTSKYAVLATGEDFPDALCASPLAKKYKSPILLNAKTALSAEVEAELKRLKVEQVIIVGGTGVISQKVEDQIKAMNIEVTRV